LLKKQQESQSRRKHIPLDGYEEYLSLEEHEEIIIIQSPAHVTSAQIDCYCIYGSVEICFDRICPICKKRALGNPSGIHQVDLNKILISHDRLACATGIQEYNNR